MLDSQPELTGEDAASLTMLKMKKVVKPAEDK